ncbi:MAG: DEAD/DEAH box helicase family protein [Thermoguttaceae bacterium]|nr:DEAD/DEAH box helicase family protein [Thermoguttaceae bacterium]
MIKLRDYQINAINATYEWMRDNPGNPVCVAPTGSGKAVLIARICRDAWQTGRRAIVLAHVKELLEQEADKLQQYCPDLLFGVYSAGLNSRDTDSQVLVAGIQSVYNKAKQLGGFDVVLIDEAHRVSTKKIGTYRHFLKDLKEINPNTRIIGFTATPYRTGEGVIYGKDKLFDDISYEIDIQYLIGQGFLAPLVSKAGDKDTIADYDALHIERGDFVTEEVENLVMEPKIVWYACRDLLAKTADRQSVLIFAVSIAHAQVVQDIITNDFHQECGLITGKTTAEERAAMQARFKSKELKYLVNVNVLTTGFDSPGIDSVVLLRPTASPVLYVQMVGRGFRIAEGKTNCLVLDYGGNVMRHGPVTNVNVRDGKPKRESDRERDPKKTGMKTCPNCDAIIERYWMKCPYCEYEWPIHEMVSDSADIMGGEVESQSAEVQRVKYRVWQKKGDPSAPLTMRVDYQIGFGDFVSEWVCPEHQGYAYKRFCEWWDERCNIEPPDTAEECVLYAEAGLLAEPLRITYVPKPGTSYREIKHVFLGPKPDVDRNDIPKPETATAYNEFGNFNDFDF